MTSVVVRSWRCGKDSTGPKSSVDIEKWDKTICKMVSNRRQYSEIDTCLDMQRTCDNMRDQEIRDGFAP